MSTNDTRGPPGGSRAVESGSTELADLAAELNALTDLMESEWNERRTISAEHAYRLGELRRKFERLIEQ